MPDAGALEHHELTVSELCAVLQLPQSTVSRHLRLLADADWVSSRRDGTSRYYALALDGAAGPRSQIWDLTRPQVAARAGAEQDERRLARVLAGRREASQQFFATSAGQWDRLREELFGRDFLPAALLGLCCRRTGPLAIWAAAPARCCRCWRPTWLAWSAWMRRDEMLAAAARA